MTKLEQKMIKQENRAKVLKCLRDACDEVPEVRVYLNYNKDTDTYEDKVTLYATDRAVTIFEKTYKILESGCDEVESINYIYEYGICEVTLK